MSGKKQIPAEPTNVLHGGLSFTPVSFNAIETLPLPARVAIPIDNNSIPVVNIGDRVLKGQPLVSMAHDIVMSHASVSGYVTDIVNGLIKIDSDGQDKSSAEKPHDNLTATQLKELFHQYGLVGLGGAAFPVEKKLNAACNATPEMLLINAAECDPAIYCDEALMQERTAECVKGIELALTVSGAKKCIVGIEENKTTAIEQLKTHLPDTIELIAVPAIYPSGAENTLFSLCTGTTGGPRENSSLCFNIATCYSIYKAVTQAEPLISRVVTVVANNTVRNFELRIGTPLVDLCTALNLPGHLSIKRGGQMMGWSVSADSAIDKRTNSLIFHTEKLNNEVACIRCGACADVCPQHLLPQQLFWHTQPHNSPALINLNLKNCIDCACCDAVCPSKIPLAAKFINAKKIIHQEHIEQQKADIAKIRYEKRLLRLQSQSLRERKKLDTKTASLSSAANKDQIKKDMIAKALQRKAMQRSKDQKKQSLGTSQLPDTSQSPGNGNAEHDG